MFRAGALLGVVLAGCAAPPVIDAGVVCPSDPIAVGAFPALPAGLGAETTVKFGVQLAACPGTPPRSIGARAAVFDPLNRPVELSVDAGPSDMYRYAWLLLPPGILSNAGPGQLAEFDVRFTPTMLGPYHVVVSFVPNLGSGQVDVPVFIDRRDAGFSYQRYTTPAPCSKVAFQGAALLCLANQGVTVPGGANVLPGSDFAADEIIWSLGLSPDGGWLLSTAAMDAGELEQKAVFAPPEPFGKWVALGGATMVASGERLLVFTSGVMESFRYTGNIEHSSFINHPFDSLYGVQWLGGESALVTGSVLVDGVQTEAACAFNVVDGGFSCVPGRQLGSDGRWLWSRDGGLVSARQLQRDGGIVERSGPAEVPFTLFNPGFGPTQRASSKVPGLDPILQRLVLDPDPTLELFPLPPGSQVVGVAHSGFVDGRYWESYNDNTLFIMTP